MTRERIPLFSVFSSSEDEQPVIRTATTYVIHGGEGSLSDEEFEAIKEHCINPVDSREAQGEKPETLVTVFDEPADVKSLTDSKIWKKAS